MSKIRVAKTLMVMKEIVSEMEQKLEGGMSV